MSITAVPWWASSFVYQIYPRSFRDADGDGIGDLKGITQGLDYLQALGVDMLWLSPIYKSPNDDNGYDVSDYCDIMDEFGTMADFDELVAEAKKRGIKLILDVVLNHSSDEHPWFQSARQSKDSPYRDYYIWREGKNGEVPNNWPAFFGGSAWEYNEATGDYYLHLFSKKQPDLNWDNPQLRQEIYRTMRFWLDKGIGGFRIDVLPFFSKRSDLPDIITAPGEDPTAAMMRTYADGPHLHEYLQEMHREVLSKYDCYTVGEGPGVYTDTALMYIAPERRELDTIYYFDHMSLDYDFLTGQHKALDKVAFKKVLSEWDQKVGQTAWNTFYLSNHDQPRPLSRFGSEKPEFRSIAAKMLAVLLFTQRAIPYLYQGDEIGMSNRTIRDISEVNDIAGHNVYRQQKARGVPEQDILAGLSRGSRDHARYPFQWSDAPHAGFTQGPETWLKVNENYPEVNAAAAQKDPDSIWHWYKKLIRLRKSTPAWITGAYQDIDPEHPHIWAYTRTHEKERWLILLNWSEKTIRYSVPESAGVLAGKTPVLSNYGKRKAKNNEVRLRPFEARLYK